MFLSKRFYNIVRSSASQLLVLSAIAVLASVSVFAQKAPLAGGANIDQCANGQLSSPGTCTGNNWQNGNVGQQNGHYYEGDSIPYRILFSGAKTSGTNTVTIEWDTTQNGRHAIDYITSYDRTETAPGNDPCSGVVCGLIQSPAFPIPADTNVTGLGKNQIAGAFTMWGGTITSVGAAPYYTRTGTYAGSSSTRITITFTTNQSNPVLAWGGHIATSFDWSNLGGSASTITGSPYHMRVLEFNGSGGNQDRSLGHVLPSLNSQITIIKDVANSTASTSFPFTATGVDLSPNFSLVDDGTPNDATSNAKTFNNLLSPGTTRMYTVTETDPAGTGFTLSDIQCTVSNGGIGSSGSGDIVTRTASITLAYGDSVTCTFTNTRLNPSAAGVSVSGRVLTADLAGLTNATVELSDAAGNTRTTRTSSFGYYSFDDVEVGQVYVVSVISKRFVFGSRVVSLLDAIGDLDFIAGQ